MTTQTMKPRYRHPDYRAVNRRIVSIDGEGHQVDGRHAYVLLAAADDRGFRACLHHDGTTRPGTASAGTHCPYRKPRPGTEPHHCEHCYRPTDVGPNHGIATVDALEFLLGLVRKDTDLFISFSFTYDTTKILHDVPWQNLCELATYGSTQWNGYTISEMQRKYFEVSDGKRCVTVWDVFSFWQMSFAKALDKSKRLFDHTQQDIIKFITEMKLERSHLETMPAERVLEYCYNECEFLSVLFRDLYQHTQSDVVDLSLRRYSGPGALAESFFSREQIKHYMPETTQHTTAGMPLTVPIHSYYGGRFETSVLGIVGDVIEYDIHSAYPSIAVDLPCLACGVFKEVNEFEPGRLGFYFVGSRTSGPWAPFPFRSDGSDEHRAWLNGAGKDSIAFVHGGRRWVTSYEVDVARKHFGTDAIPVYKGWVFIPGCTHMPFKRVAELYLERMRLKEQDAIGNAGLVMVLKLIINSIYGKTAQSIGVKFDPHTIHHHSTPEAYKDPETQCYIWAALMTGGTRAKVLEAALLGGIDVVSIATDGILTRRPLDQDAIPDKGLPVTKYDLGTWEREDKTDCWLGMPGIYAFGRDEDATFKRRGLDGRYFPAFYLRREFERGEWVVPPMCIDCKGVGCDQCNDTGEGEVRAFMPLRLALMRSNGLDQLGEWTTAPKRVQFGSVIHKRNLPDDIMIGLPHDGDAIPLEVITVPDEMRSKPYQPKVTWETLYKLSEMEDFIGTEYMETLLGDPDMPMWDSTDLDELKG